jgi:endonuclease-8
MPEGHTIHRAARLQGKRFAGARIRVDSPQGRFGSGADVLDGRVLEGIDALGKHLFYRWEDEVTLHVHLGLFGKFGIWSRGAPAPTEGTRMRWIGEPGVLHLAGPTACELMEPHEEEAVRSRLGPDPLAIRSGDQKRFAAGLQRRKIPVAQALLDQKVIAGVGNVYRAEFCFLAGIDPHRPANEVTEREADGLWRLAVDHMKVGERIGRIVTVDPTEAGVSRWRDVPRGERLYAYKREDQPCRRCGDEIRRTEMANRRVWWCPACQPG